MSSHVNAKNVNKAGLDSLPTLAAIELQIYRAQFIHPTTATSLLISLKKHT